MEPRKSLAKTVSNRKNALKSTGPITPEGKEVVKNNALRHGLLSKDIVITSGNAPEDPEVYFTLVTSLITQFNPVGTLELTFVEKIAACLWRQGRALRYESGLIREQTEEAEEEFYEKEVWNKVENEQERVHKTDQEIDLEVKEKKRLIKVWKQDKIDLRRMLKDGKPLDEIYNWNGNWETLLDIHEKRLAEQGITIGEGYPGPGKARQLLNQAGWDDKRIWEEQIKLCDVMVKVYTWEIRQSKEQKTNNRSKLQIVKMVNCIPSGLEQDKLLRYEAAIERQLYKALNQLERLQRMRLGDKVPAPIAVDVDVNTE